MTDFAPKITFGGILEGASSTKQDEIIQELVELNTTDFSTEAKQDIQITNQELLQTVADNIKQLIENSEDFQSLLVQILKPLGIVTSGSARLSMDINAVTGNVAQVTLVPTVTTVGNVANQTLMGGINAFAQMKNLSEISLNTLNSNINF